LRMSSWCIAPQANLSLVSAQHLKRRGRSGWRCEFLLITAAFFFPGWVCISRRQGGIETRTLSAHWTAAFAGALVLDPGQDAVHVK
jgi:hypothetical protein